MKFILIIVLFSNLVLASAIVKGYSKDYNTNEPLIGCVILHGGVGIAVTDSSGFFMMTLKEGTYHLTARMLGYKHATKEITITANQEYVLFFYLVPQPIEIEKVTVFGERFSESQKYKTYELTTGDLKNIPVFIESDPIRAVQALPGVTQSHDLSDLVFLRGGNFDETLITLDEVPVYNPHHAGGVYSIFNTDIVEREILYPSNYPVKYSNTLSGVLSLYSKDGNRDKIGGVGAIGLLSGKVFLEGPLGNGSFVLSGRRTYPDLILNTFTDFPYYFYDFNGKYSLPIDNNNLISANFFYSKDIYRLYESTGLSSREIDYKNEDLNWGNIIGKLSYIHLFDNGSLEIAGYFSSSNSGADAKTKRVEDERGNVRESEHIIIDNYLRDLSLKSNLALNLPGQSINLTLQYNRINTNYYWDILDETLSQDINGNIQDIFFDFAPTRFSQTKNEIVISASISDEIILTPSLTAILAYRMTYLNSISDYLHSPYLRFTHKLMNSLELSLSYGKYHQYLFTNKDLIYSSTYAPFTPYFLPQNKNEVRSSDHYSAGFKWFEIFPDMDFEVEGYYKSRNNILSSDAITNTIALVNGYAFGADLLLKKTEGFITGWLNYSFSRSIKEDKYKYYASYDRTHTLKVLLNFNLSESWQFNAYWIYATGLPYTPAIGKYLSGLDYDPDSAEDGRYYGLNNFIWELYYGRKNTVRYSSYTRLDIGITGRFIWWGLIAKPYLQILNVYRSMNAFDYDPRPDDTSVHDGSKRGSEIIPTIGISIEF